jgi:uncharacterized protein
MAVSGEYLGMPVAINDLDRENLAYFRYCADHDFRLQRCRPCGLFRYPPGTACPWCAGDDFEWASVEPRGEVHSYGEVHHAIQPSFRGHTPYMILLVDLDTQKGQPTPHHALRVAGNLVTPSGELAPQEMVRQVGIGSRLRMVFVDAGEGIAIPQWTIDEDAEQPAHPWRYPQE